MQQTLEDTSSTEECFRMEWRPSYLASLKIPCPWSVKSLEFENMRFHAADDVLSCLTPETVATPSSVTAFQNLAACSSEAELCASTFAEAFSHILNVGMQAPETLEITTSRGSRHINQHCDVLVSQSIYEDLIDRLRHDTTNSEESAAIVKSIDTNAPVNSLLTMSDLDTPILGESVSQCGLFPLFEDLCATTSESSVLDKIPVCRPSGPEVRESGHHSRVVLDHERTMRIKQRAPTKRVAQMKLAELSEYFDMPIREASKKLKIGVTVLKKKCREFGVSRWPHRKIKSLDSLIRSIQDSAIASNSKVNDKAILIVKTLEEERKLIRNRPETQLNSRIKRLRQASFKNNFRSRRKQLKMRESTGIPQFQNDESSVYTSPTIFIRH